MLAVALSSFKEALGKKIVLIIGVLTFVYILLLAAITYYGMSFLKSQEYGTGTGDLLATASTMVSFLGFYFSSMITSLLTIMASVGTVSSEIESGVVYSVITKPVTRSRYIAGKFTGLAVLSMIYSAFLFIVIVLINYIMGVPPLDKLHYSVLSGGLALFLLEPLAILALSIWGGTSFKTINNGIFMVSLYILGMLGGMMEQIGSVTGLDGLTKSGIVISLISPFDSVYRKMMEVVYSASNVPLMFSSPLFLSGTSPSSWMMLYVVLYTVLMLILAIRKFNRKDIS